MKNKKMSKEKKIVRKKIKTIIENIPNYKREEKKLLIIKKIKNFPLFKKSSKIGLFYAKEDEINLNLIWGSQKKIYFPKFSSKKKQYSFVLWDRQEFEKGFLGIPEPKGYLKEEELDLIFVPGLAFDKEKIRLGRGKGFYDKMLQSIRGVKVGTCFYEQMLEKIPRDPWDISMDYIINDKEIF